MPPSPRPPNKNSQASRTPDRKARREPRMIERGILCIIIGAAVLAAPYFVTSDLWQQMTGGARIVGWFAVVLGVALVVVDVLQRVRQRDR